MFQHSHEPREMGETISKMKVYRCEWKRNLSIFNNNEKAQLSFMLLLEAA